MSNHYDQTEIEETLFQMVKRAGVSQNIFKGMRPDTTNNKMLDFVVVKITGRIYDRAAYGETVCSIDLYARNISGMKNGKKLSEMFRKVDSLLPRAEGKLRLSEPTIVADAPDNYGFTTRLININTLIKIV